MVAETTTAGDVALDEIARQSRRAAAGTLVGVALVLAALAFAGWRIATTERRIQALDEAASGRLAEADAQLRAKRQELRRLQEQLEQKTKQLEATNSVLRAIGDAGPQGSELVRTAVEKTIDEKPEVGTLPRVYFHIGDEAQRDAASALAERLQQRGFLVPGVERVAEVPAATELRFFREIDRDLAHEIVELLRADGLPAKAKYVRGHETSRKIRPKHFELWIAGEGAFDEGRVQRRLLPRRGETP